MIRITDILDKTQAYLTTEEQELIEKAYVFSARVHRDQLRLSGEPYLTHPLEVAGILADMRLDAATIATGLLHDTVEDTFAHPGADRASLWSGCGATRRRRHEDRED